MPQKTPSSRRGRTTALLVTAAAAAVLGAGSLFAGVLGELRPGAAPASASPRLELDAALPLGGTAVAVRSLERAVRVDPRDAGRLGQLGLAYQLRWRETGDPSFLPLSESALRRALEARPRDAAATLGLGNLALIRHDFRGALALGHEARRRAPFAVRPYGVVGDALIELGRYPQAFAAFDRMAAVKPSLASYARVAYARELTGDRRGAAAAMNLALDAAGGVPEPTAWAHVELAKLALGDGLVDAAARHVRAALAIFPGYVLALEQQARVDAARGRLGAAAATARRAAIAVPLPQFVALLGDLLDRQGRTVAAARQRATVAAIDRVLGRERAARRPRERGLPGRPPHPAGGDGASRAPRPFRATLDLRRRRARVGTRARRTMRRGRAVARPCAASRDEGRTPLLPSRVCRRLRRRRPRDARVVPTGARAEPGLLGEVGAGRSGGARVRRLASVVAALVAVAGRPRPAAGSIRASTRQLHGQPLRRDRGRRRPRLRPLRPRPGRDPDLPVGRPRACASVSVGACAPTRSPARRRASRSAPAGTPRLGAPGSRRSPDAEVRGRLRRVAPRLRVHVRRPELREPHRLAGGHGACPRRCAPRLVVRPGWEPLGRAALVSARPPSLAPRRSLGDGAFRRGDGARCASPARPVRGAGPHGRRARGAHRA